MQNKVLDRWWPVTYDFGLIHAKLSDVAATRSKMFEKAGLKVEATRLSGSLEDCLSVLEPLSPAPTKEIFFATTFGWTVYFSNGCRGSDPSLALRQLSKTLGVTALRACLTPSRALYPAVILEVYDTPEAGGDEYGYRRSIAAMNDGGRWIFEHSGTPYPFEDTSKYDATRKPDRFTPDMLDAYLKHLGSTPLSDDSLQPDGTCTAVLLARPLHDHLPSYSLDDAKAL